MGERSEVVLSQEWAKQRTGYTRKGPGGGNGMGPGGNRLLDNKNKYTNFIDFVFININVYKNRMFQNQNKDFFVNLPAHNPPFKFFFSIIT